MTARQHGQDAIAPPDEAMPNDGKENLLVELESVLRENAHFLLILLDEEDIGPLEEEHERLKSERDRLLLLERVPMDADYDDAVRALQEAGREIEDAGNDPKRGPGVTERLGQAAMLVAKVAAA